jgi:hypothetical protein
MLKTFALHGGARVHAAALPGRSRLCKEHLIDDASRSPTDELAAWTVEEDQVLVF